MVYVNKIYPVSCIFHTIATCVLNAFSPLIPHAYFMLKFTNFKKPIEVLGQSLTITIKL